MNERRGCLQLTPPISNPNPLLSNRAVFPAETVEHRASTHAGKGDGGRLRNGRDVAELQRRQQMIADLFQEPDLLASIRTELKSIRDIERSVGRLSQASGNARDLVALKTSLGQVPKLKRELQKLIDRIEFGANPLEAAVSDANQAQQAVCLPPQLQREIREMPALAEKLAGALVDDPPFAVKEGGIFCDGYDRDLDALRQASRDGKNWISQLQEREIVATGIKSLKVRYNSVFGYFIEITKSNLASVPEHYTRKQTTVGGERFITPELKEMEAKILGADEIQSGTGTSNVLSVTDTIQKRPIS